MSLLQRLLLVIAVTVGLAALLIALRNTNNGHFPSWTVFALAAAGVGIFVWSQVRAYQTPVLQETIVVVQDTKILGNEIRTWIAMIGFAAMFATAIAHPFTQRIWNHLAVVAVGVGVLAALAVYNRFRFGMFFPGRRTES